MLGVGSTAPDFALPDETGAVRSLGDLLADGPLVLWFYPGDFTPICTREACAFRDAAPDLAPGTGRVVGISAQDAASHARFKQAYGLNFTLLADTERVAIRAYEATVLFGIGTGRVTYRIGQDRRILEAVGARFRVAPHLALLKRG
jgi:thioredoxin-dependent peroxiredoxin